MSSVNDRPWSARSAQAGGLRVWDLPVRLFHWSLVLLVIVSVTTAQIGGNAMQIHEWSGFTILALVLFRVLWGLVGGGHARFADFVRGPRAVLSYARSLWRGPAQHYAGHNPLGGWMVVALLTCLLVQTGTGLFSNDDVMTEGPLVKWISKDTSDFISGIHEANSKLLLALVALHVAAAIYYLVAKRDNLIRPMITGRKTPPAGETWPEPRPARLWLAAALIGVTGIAVYLLVR